MHGIPAEKDPRLRTTGPTPRYCPRPRSRVGTPQPLATPANLGVVHEVGHILDAIEHFRNDARFRFRVRGGRLTPAKFEVCLRANAPLDNVLFRTRIATAPISGCASPRATSACDAAVPKA